MGWADTGAVAAGGLAGALPEADTAAAALLAQASSAAGRPRLDVLAARLADLTDKDPALAQRVRAEVVAALTPVERGQLAAFEDQYPVAVAIGGGQQVVFEPATASQDGWIVAERAENSPLYQQLVALAGSDRPAAIKGLLDRLYAAAVAPATPGALGQVDTLLADGITALTSEPRVASSE